MSAATRTPRLLASSGWEATSASEVTGATTGRDWLRLLAEEADKSSAAEVARRLGVSRTAVSLCLGGKYPGGTGRMAQRVLSVLGERWCPLLRCAISAGQCAAQCQQAAPVHNPAKMRGWGLCQRCALNPANAAPVKKTKTQET